MNGGKRLAIGMGQVLAFSMLINWGGAMAATLGGKLELEDEGSFFVNGQSIRSEYPGQNAVAAWMTPDAPFSYCSTAFTTSSDSIRCAAAICHVPNTSRTGPASQRRTST